MLFLFALSLIAAVTKSASFDSDTKYCIEHALDPSIDTPTTKVNKNSNPQCNYPAISASQALIEMRDKWIVFMGESTMRQLFLQFIGIIDSEPYNRIEDQKGHYKIEIRKSGSRFTFYYDAYYNNITDHTDKPPQLFDGRLPDLLVLNDGLHDLLYAYEQSDKAWTKLAKRIIDFDKQWGDTVPIMWVPPAQLHDTFLRKSHQLASKVFRNDTLYKFVEKQKETISKLKYGFFYDVFKNVSFQKASVDFDGVHSMERARKEAEGFIRALHYFNKDELLWGKNKDITVGQVMCFFTYAVLTLVVLIGEILKRLYYKQSRSSDIDDEEGIRLLRLDETPVKAKTSNLEMIVTSGKGDGSMTHERQVTPTQSSKTNENGTNNDNTTNNELASLPNNANKLRKSPTDGKLSDVEMDDNTTQGPHILQLPNSLDVSIIRQFAQSYIDHESIYRASWQFGVCIIVLYMTDGPNHLFFPSLKHYNRDFFIFLHLIFLAISYLTMKKNEHPKAGTILDRLQTEEWKGIMQIVFVMYHYYDAAEVYNLIRVFIAAYVWMTGFGNTAYFLKSNDFSISRVFGMFFRLNWLVFWTCLMLNQQLMLYYICPLHTFFFLMCYIVWSVGHSYNDKPYFVVLKLVVCLVCLMAMFEISVTVFEWCWVWLRWLLEFHGTLYEWHFRTTLDHYATWFGMVFAVYYKYVWEFTQKIEASPNVRIWKCGISSIVIAALIIWYNYVYMHEKADYNAMHPYTSWVPIFSYIALRNMYKPSRKWYSRFLEWMGQITLETYIFQYHLFMIDDAKSILVMIPDYPLVNFVIVSCFYIFLSRIAFDATNKMRNYLYPGLKKGEKENIGDVLKQTLKYCSCIGLLYGVSYLLWYAVA